MVNKILIPVDGSVSAEKLIEWTGSLAGQFSAEVVLLAVADPVEWIPWPSAAAWAENSPDDAVAAGIDPYPSGPQRHSIQDFQEHMMQRATSNARSYLQKQADILTLEGVRTSVEVREGSPAEVILEVITGDDIDLVVMSSRRTSAFARGVLGSVADRVIRTSSIPILVAHPEFIAEAAGHRRKIETVLVPLDGSELSEAAVGPAIAIAARARARLVFMRVLESGLMHGEPNQDERDQAVEYLAQFVEAAQSEGVRVNSRVLAGSAAALILAEAAASHGAVVAMGTHGRGGFRRFFLGSVTDKVVRSADVPVLAVPPGPENN